MIRHRWWVVLGLGIAAISGLGFAIPPGRQDRAAASGSIYTDPVYGFRLACPKDFVVQRQDVSKLGQFTPAPLASTFFMNPTMAAGGLAGIEPPDLEVRVYRAHAMRSLGAWLAASGLASPKSGRPFRNASVSGLRVCRSTMLSPGCSVYALHGDRVYQLTAVSLEGQAMIETFAWTGRP